MRPRIRTLKPEFWQDERITALSRDARLLLLGFVTMADDEGRFRARRSQIIGHVFPDDADAMELLDDWVGEVKEQGIVVFYVVDATPYGAFRHWKRHQKINRPNPSDLPAPPDPKITRENRVKRQGASTNGSVSDQGEISESSVSPHSSTRRRAFRSDPIPDPVHVLVQPTAELRTRELCYRLAFLIHRNDPQAEPNFEAKAWQDDMRLLVKDRGGSDLSFIEVQDVIDWCQMDPFWRSNILSPAKLRKQFTQLKLKSEKKLVDLTEWRESASDMLRAINGEAS